MFISYFDDFKNACVWLFQKIGQGILAVLLFLSSYPLFLIPVQENHESGSSRDFARNGSGRTIVICHNIKKNNNGNRWGSIIGVNGLY